MKTFNFGGGVQSTAVLVLQAQGKLQYDAFVFANVGDDSENPDTITYVEQYAKPFAAQHGIELVEVAKMRHGEQETLYQWLERDEKSIGIPVYLGSGMPSRRNCTSQFKIDVIARWQKARGATKENPAIVGIGISMDEIQRMRNDSGIAWQTLEYPLIDLRMNRRDCVKVIESAGLPVPPKSACWFCPFHSRENWKSLKREKPELFSRAVQLEDMLNARREALGKDRIYLHTNLIPLASAVGDQLVFDFTGDDLPCDTGYCFL